MAVRITALLLVMLASISENNIRTQLQSMQPARISGREAPALEYVVVDRWPRGQAPRTVFAVLATSSDEGTGELVAFRVDKRGALHRLTSYGNDVLSVDLRDVTGDGLPEALASSSPGNRSAPVAILQWNGGRFREIGETNDGAEYVDLDHDGIPEIVERGGGETNSCDGVTVMTFVQKLTAGRFQTITGPQPEDVFTYTKTASEPERVERYWDLTDVAPMDYDVRVINGERGGAHRATGIKLRLRAYNDASQTAVAVIPLRLTATDEYTEGTLTLPSRCTVASITVTGQVGAVVALVLRARRSSRGRP